MGAKQAKHSTEEVWDERKKYLSMSVTARRRHYFCGDGCIQQTSLPSWPEYFHKNINTSNRQTYRYPVCHEINDKIVLHDGDISYLEVDSIVNSACNPIHGTGSVNNVLLERGGEYYSDECVYKGIPGPGLTTVTGGYLLPCRYVIHTAVPHNRDEETLTECYENVLETAKGHGIRSVAFPCLGTRKNRAFNSEKAAHVALGTVRNWLEDNQDDIEKVIFCVYEDADRRIYETLLQLYFPLHDHGSTTDNSIESGQSEAQQLSEDHEIDEMARLLLIRHFLQIGAGPRPSRQEQDETQAQTQDGATASGSLTSVPLENWQIDTAEDGFQAIMLDRSTNVHMLKILHSIYHNPNLDLKRRPVIKFNGEEGLDLGALSREFFFKNLQALTQDQVIDSPAFEGNTGNRLPCASRAHLKNGVYELTGKALAHSVLHDGVPLSGLSPALVFLLTHPINEKEEVETSGVPLHIDDISDVDLITLLNKADNIGSLSDTERQSVKTEIQEAMERSNFGFCAVSDDTLPLIKQEIILYEVVYKRWDQILQMRRGMDVLGLYTFLCQNPTEENIKKVFPSPEDVRIQPSMIKAKLKPARSDNMHYQFFIRLLGDLHTGEYDSLQDLITFWTGQPVLPEGDLNIIVNTDNKLPLANCCFFKLELPGATTTYEEFQEAFQVALSVGATGFNRA